MPSSRKPLEIDAGRIFRWSFLASFLVLECLVWGRIRRRPMRRRAQPLLLLLLAPWATPRAAFAALLVAGVSTLAAMMAVRLILAPLLNAWLRPGFDPSSWMFHLSAGEAPAASVPARWKSGGRWRPGALVLTGRRIWFMPSAWSVEPWSMALKGVERVETEAPAPARLLPVHNWPDLLHFAASAGDRADFAVADPDAVLAWFATPRRPDAPPPAPQGVFDA
jgi:hypothetical protein